MSGTTEREQARVTTLFSVLPAWLEEIWMGGRGGGMICAEIGALEGQIICEILSAQAASKKHFYSIILHCTQMTHGEKGQCYSAPIPSP